MSEPETPPDPANASPTPEAATDDGFCDAGPADLAPLTMRGIDVEGERVLIARTSAGYCAVGGLCTHQVAYLEDGYLEETQVMCPRHGAAFDLATGAPLTAPADMPIAVYDIQVCGDRLRVARRPRG